MESSQKEKTLKLSLLSLTSLLIAIILNGCQPAGPHDFYVATSGNDNNTCLSADEPCRHLQAAVDRAQNQGDRIFIAAGTYNEQVSIGKSLSVAGDGTASTIISGSGICGSGSPALISVYGNQDITPQVQISNLTIRDCARWAGKNRNKGGGIDVRNAKVTLSELLVTGNKADNGGGVYYEGSEGELVINYSTITNNIALRFGGGISVLGSLVINGGTVISNNTANEAGGGIEIYGHGTIMDTIIRDNRARLRGGGIKTNASLLIINSTLDGNITEIGSGGGIWNKGFVEIYKTTISDNLAKVEGGGIYNRKVMNLENTTISGNMAIKGGGIFNAMEEGKLYLMNVTVADNGGNGILIKGGEASIYDTLAAFNDPANCLVESTFATGGDISSDQSCPGFIYQSDPMIGPLASNGGPTKTHALLPGSPAIDAAEIGDGSIMEDQRMNLRPRDGNGDGKEVNDVGAYEYDQEGVVATLVPVIYIPRTNLNCRTGPGTDWNTTSSVPAGTNLPVDGKNQDGTWVRVVLPDGTICWTFVQDEITGIEGVPVLPDPEKPFRPTETSLTPKNCSKYADEKSCESAGCDWDDSAAGLPGHCK